MMRKIKIILLLLLSITGIQAQNNLRDLVCIVKPQHSSATKEFFENYGRALAREGYIRSGSYLMAMAKCGFGTGVVIEYNGEYCALTNFHVVEYANVATIEFTSITGSDIQVEECEIIAKDKDYDLALIKLPNDTKIKSGFNISHMTLNEGTEVWSAGFPGIGNNPSWQLGKGIISNAFFKDSVLNNTKLSYAIQHTAQVDAGSSGGPLLIANPEEKPGYSIVGINTWKVRGREGANFAIPADIVLAFLKDINSTEIENENLIEEVTERTHDLIKSGKSENYKAILPFISNNYIFSIPETIFMNTLSVASKDAAKDADNALRAGEPFEAFRIIIADALYRRQQIIEMTDIIVKKDSSKIFSEGIIKGKKIEMEWKWESGNWNLVNSTLLKIKEDNNIYTKDWSEINRSTYAGIGINKKENEYSFGFQRYFSQYVISFSEFVYGNREVEVVEEEMQSLNKSKSLTYGGFSYGFQFQLPMKLSSVYIIPFMKIPVGINIGMKIANVHIGVRPGLRVAIKVGKNDKKFLYLDTEYRYRYAKSIDDDYNLPPSVSSFGLCFGFAY